MRLTEHFSTEEFACHDGTPAPSWSYTGLRQLAAGFLEPLRARYGPVRIISGYRPAGYNRQVGGAPNSFHIYRRARAGVACDLACARARPADWYRTLDLMHPGGLGRYPGHVHVDTRPGHARW